MGWGSRWTVKARVWCTNPRKQKTVKWWESRMGLYALPWGQESWAKLQDRDGKHGKPEEKKEKIHRGRSWEVCTEWGCAQQVTGKLEATQSLISSHKSLVLASESAGRYPSPLLKQRSRQVFTHSNRWHTGKQKLNRVASASTTTAGGHKQQLSITKVHGTGDQDQAFCFRVTCYGEA